MTGGKGTSAEVPAITSSNPGHNGFNMVSIWPPEPFSSVSVGRGGIVGLSERSEYLDYQKNNIYIYIYIYICSKIYFKIVTNFDYKTKCQLPRMDEQSTR